jgi:hypothetical protein
MQAAALSALVRVIRTDLVRLWNTVLATQNSFGLSVAAVGERFMKFYFNLITHEC